MSNTVFIHALYNALVHIQAKTDGIYQEGIVSIILFLFSNVLNICLQFHQEQSGHQIWKKKDLEEKGVSFKPEPVCLVAP